MLRCGSFPQSTLRYECTASEWVVSGPQLLQDNLLQRRLPFRVLSFYHLSASVLAFHKLQLSSGHIDILQQHPPWVAEGHTLSLWSSPWVAGKSLLWCLAHNFPLLLWPWCLQSFFHMFYSFLSQLLHSAFYPFLNKLL